MAAGAGRQGAVGRLAVAAFGSQVIDQRCHGVQPGAVTLEASLLFHREQPGLGQGLQVERGVIRGEAEGTGNIARDQPGWPGLDQQAVDVQPDPGGQGFKDGNGG